MIYKLFGILIIFATLGVFGYAFMRSPAGATFLQNISHTPGRSNLSLSSGLVGHWTFDGKDTAWNSNTTQDKSGQGNTGTMTNMSTTTSPVEGRIGQGFSFDPVNDEIAVADSASLDVTGPGTFAAWVYMYDTNSGERRVLSKTPGSGTAPYVLKTSNANQLKFVIASSSVAAGTTITGNTVLEANRWYHAVGVYDGAQIQVYLDGVSDATPVSHTEGIWASTGNLRIGFSGGDDFNGKLDDVRIYNRALSADEIKQLYQQGASLKQNITHTSGRSNLSLSSGLVGHWTFDGKDTNWGANTTSDKSGNNNTGTMTNMSTSSSPVTGKVGQGFQFDGTNDWINITDNAVFTLTASEKYTWSSWIKPANFDEFSTAWMQDSGGGSVPFFTVIPHTSSSGIYGPVTAGISAGWENNSSNRVHIQTFNNVLALNTWSHVLVTYDGSLSQASRINIYVNGVNQTDTGDIQNEGSISTFNPTTIRIGWSGVSGEEYGGGIDDTRFYNRLLSTEEIKQLYEQGASLKQNVTQTSGRSNLSLSSGLVGHWTFDGKDTAWNSNTTQDKSGQGNTGTMTSMSTTTSPVEGRIGQGFNFDGANDYINVTDSASLDVTGPITLAAWMKLDTLPGTSANIISKWRGSGSNGLPYLIRVNSQGQLQFNVASDCNAADTNIQTSASFISTKQWYHVVGVYDGSNLSLYSNGSSAATPVAYSSGLCSSDGNLNIGARNAALLWNGIIDDARIYNRALSADEIKALYQMGR